MAFDAAALCAKADEITKKKAAIDHLRADHLGLSMKKILAEQRGSPAERAAAKLELREYDQKFETAIAELGTLEGEMIAGHAELMANLEIPRAAELAAAPPAAIAPTMIASGAKRTGLAALDIALDPNWNRAGK